MQGVSRDRPVVTQESVLLDTAKRLGRAAEGRVALHFHLSRLKPGARQEGYLRVALRLCEPTVGLNRGQAFKLLNGDIVLILAQPKPDDVDGLIEKVRGLWAKDPLTFGGARASDRFCTVYDLQWQNTEFVKVAEELAKAAAAPARGPGKGAPAQPMDAEGLAQALAALDKIDVAPLMRRQMAVQIQGAKAPVMMQELYVSVPDLTDAVLKGRQLTANRWLFQHLSMAMDAKLLDVLMELTLETQPGTYSLNLNVGSIATPAFQRFEKWANHRSAIIAELQLLDVFAHIDQYLEARDWLQGRGHKVCIDGLDATTLDLVETSLLGADFYKLSWTPGLQENEANRFVRETFDYAGWNRAILSRVDTEIAIHWGLINGISRFQGRYVDAMLGYMTKNACGPNCACTLAQCINRRALVAGADRAACGHLDLIDAEPVMAAPRRPVREGA